MQRMLYFLKGRCCITGPNPNGELEMVFDYGKAHPHLANRINQIMKTANYQHHDRTWWKDEYSLFYGDKLVALSAYTAIVAETYDHFYEINKADVEDIRRQAETAILYFKRCLAKRGRHIDEFIPHSSSGFSGPLPDMAKWRWRWHHGQRIRTGPDTVRIRHGKLIGSRAPRDGYTLTDRRRRYWRYARHQAKMALVAGDYEHELLYDRPGDHGYDRYSL